MRQTAAKIGTGLRSRHACPPREDDVPGIHEHTDLMMMALIESRELIDCLWDASGKSRRAQSRGNPSLRHHRNDRGDARDLGGRESPCRANSLQLELLDQPFSGTLSWTENVL